MNDKEFDSEFIIGELGCIYNQATWIINQVATLEKLALISSGVFWAWIATHPWSTLYEVIVWFPSLLVGLLYIKVFLLAKSLKSAQLYFIEVEKSFNLNQLGWQSWKSKYSKNYMTIWAGIYWILLFTSNFFIALLFPFSELAVKASPLI